VDSKKTEMAMNFKNNGEAWHKRDFEAGDHDFRQYAEGIAKPIAFMIFGLNRQKPYAFVQKQNFCLK